MSKTLRKRPPFRPLLQQKQPCAPDVSATHGVPVVTASLPAGVRSPGRHKRRKHPGLHLPFHPFRHRLRKLVTKKRHKLRQGLRRLACKQVYCDPPVRLPPVHMGGKRPAFLPADFQQNLLQLTHVLFSVPHHTHKPKDRKKFSAPEINRLVVQAVSVSLKLRKKLLRKLRQLPAAQLLRQPQDVPLIFLFKTGDLPQQFLHNSLTSLSLPAESAGTHGFRIPALPPTLWSGCRFLIPPAE